MSLERDAQEIKQLVEAENIFKPASKDAMKLRLATRKAELAKHNIIPIDAECSRMSGHYWGWFAKLKNRLDVLSREHRMHQSEDSQCQCDAQVIEELEGEEGSWLGIIDLPGDHGYVISRCMRCGGWVEAD